MGDAYFLSSRSISTSLCQSYGWKLVCYEEFWVNISLTYILLRIELAIK